MNVPRAAQQFSNVDPQERRQFAAELPDSQQIAAAQRAAQLDKATKARIAAPPVRVQYTTAKGAKH